MASRTDSADARFTGMLIGKNLKLDFKRVTLAADNYVVTVDDPPVLYIDPAAAARDILLPAIAGNFGLTFIIFNASDATGGEDLTLKTSADGAISPSPVVAVGEGVIVHNNGIGWRALVSSFT